PGFHRLPPRRRRSGSDGARSHQPAHAHFPRRPTHRGDSRMTQTFRLAAFAAVCFALPQSSLAQGTKADYQRAVAYRQKMANTVERAKVEPHWFDNGDKFWYRNDLAGGKKEFVVVDAVKGAREVIAEDKLPKALEP